MATLPQQAWLRTPKADRCEGTRLQQEMALTYAREPGRYAHLRERVVIMMGDTSDAACVLALMREGVKP